LREARRERDVLRRADQDVELAHSMQAKLMEMFPSCPAKEAQSIARHTSVRGSGRVGRSEAGRSLSEEALHFAAVAYIRHRHTKYDELLMRGWDRASARREVRDRIDGVLERWSNRSTVRNTPMLSCIRGSRHCGRQHLRCHACPLCYQSTSRESIRTSFRFLPRCSQGSGSPAYRSRS
jgi:hypothetical protein